MMHVLVPLDDLVQLQTLPSRVAQLEAAVSSLDRSLTALRGLYSDLLAKVADLDRQLLD